MGARWLALGIALWFIFGGIAMADEHRCLRSG